MLCSRHTRTVGATVTDCSRVVLSSSILYRRFLESPLRFGAICLASLGVTRHDSLCPSSSFVLDNTNGQLLYRLLAFVRSSSIDPSVNVLDSTLHSCQPILGHRRFFATQTLALCHGTASLFCGHVFGRACSSFKIRSLRILNDVFTVWAESIVAAFTPTVGDNDRLPLLYRFRPLALS